MVSDRNRLEAPSFKLRRKRSKAADEVDAEPEVEETTPVEEAAPVEETAPDDEAANIEDETVELEDEAVENESVYEAPAPPLEAEPEAEDEPDALASPRPRLGQRVPGPVAAALTGGGVGVFLVLAIAGIERVGQAVRGTSSLGGFGVPMLIVIFVVAVYLGFYALRALAIPSPGTTAFLGTGLVGVMAMFFFPGAIGTVAGGIAIVVISVITFTLSRWVSVKYLD